MSNKMDWQDIRTAPKDQYVLTCFAQFGKTYAVLMQLKDGQWIDENDSMFTRPTHWAPIDPPPGVTP